LKIIFNKSEININIKGSEIFPFVTSLVLHLLFMLAIIFLFKPEIPKPVKDTFKVLLFYEPKSPALEQEKVTRLYGSEKSSGASVLSKKEDSNAVKEGLKKGVTLAEQKPLIFKKSTPPQKKGEKKFKLARKETRGEDMIKKENGAFKKEEENAESAKGEAEDKGKDEKTVEKGTSSNITDPGQAGKKSGFSARNMDKDLLSKYAGRSSKDGLGGEDEDGEGGIDSTGGSGKTVDLNTNDLKFLSYFKHIKDLIESVWIYPREAREKGIDGQLVIKFTIRENGELGPVEVLASSGYKFLDAAAVQALSDASPFPTLPKQWKKKEITISGNFIYYLYRKSLFY